MYHHRPPHHHHHPPHHHPPHHHPPHHHPPHHHPPHHHPPHHHPPHHHPPHHHPPHHHPPHHHPPHHHPHRHRHCHPSHFHPHHPPPPPPPTTFYISNEPSTTSTDDITIEEEHESGQLKSAAAVSHSLSSSLSTSFPLEWDNSDSNLELKYVSKGSQEWLNVETNMKKTMPDSNIIQIERIQNKFLYTKYDLCKKRMVERNNGVINEKMLFHGTRETTPDTIYKSEHGFDFRYGGNGMWGKGAYFAVNASYSNNYAYNKHGAGKQMFMAFVLTGITAVIPHSEPRARSLVVPPNNEATGLPYDSVTGHSGSSQIYIVYDHDKSYPAYLITFQ